MKSLITYEEFSRIDLRIGKITQCEKVEGSEKLLRLAVDFGEEGVKKILSGIAKYYSPENLVGNSFVFIINLESRKIMGEYSEGMILAADHEKPVLLAPLEETPAGSCIR